MKKILSFLKTQAFYYTQHVKAQKAFDSLTSDEQHLFLMLERVRGKGLYSQYIRRVLKDIYVKPYDFPVMFRLFIEEVKDQAVGATGGLLEILDWETVVFLLQLLRGINVMVRVLTEQEQLGEEHAVRMQKDYRYN